MPVASPCTAGHALLLVGLAVGGCSPEVLIASNDDPAGGGSVGVAGTAGIAGTAGSGGVGGSEPVPSEAGQGGEVTTPEAPRLLADSVADFSFVQGQHGWYYGYDDGTSATYAPMTMKGVITTYTPPSGDIWDCWTNDTIGHWTQIFQLGAHSNGTDTSMPAMPVLERAVRRWVSSYEGDVRITGEVAKIDVAVAGGSNGVEALVVVDGVDKGSFRVGAEDTGGWSYEVMARVDVDSTVDFVLDPYESNDHHDLTRFTGIIERVDVP